MNLVNQLAGLLEQNAQLYEQMCVKAEEEARAIQTADFARLDELLKERENLALKLRLLDENRKSLVAKIAQSIGKRGEEITLGWLADIQANETVKAGLLAAKDRLVAASEKAKDLSDFNRRLIGRAMTTIRESLRFASVLIGQPDTYSNGRTVAGRMPSGMMVTKAY
ncbi:MAG: flagellar protein FlgN [Nitrospinae bacterium]|nr:flagellar protein FlgN [Nitrospinota bacterium]